MNNKMDYIDKLYSDKFENFEFHTSDDEWERLSSKLTKTNFLKFSFVNFNVYYLSAIITFFAFLAFWGFINTQIAGEQGTPQIHQNNKIEIKTLDEEQKYTADSTATVSAQEQLKSQIITKPKDKIQDKKTITSIANDSLEIELTKQVAPAAEDSLYKNADTTTYSKSDTSSVKVTQTPKIKRVKRTIVIKKDEVIVTDTVKIKKRVK